MSADQGKDFDERSLHAADPREAPRDHAERERRAERIDAERELRRTIRAVFLTAEGVRVLEHLRDRFVRPGGYSAADHRRDTHYAVYRDGQRDLVHYLEDQIRAAREDDPRG